MMFWLLWDAQKNQNIIPLVKGFLHHLKAATIFLSPFLKDGFAMSVTHYLQFVFVCFKGLAFPYCLTDVSVFAVFPLGVTLPQWTPLLGHTLEEPDL